MKFPLAFPSQLFSGFSSFEAGVILSQDHGGRGKPASLACFLSPLEFSGLMNKNRIDVLCDIANSLSDEPNMSKKRPLVPDSFQNTIGRDKMQSNVRKVFVFLLLSH